MNPLDITAIPAGDFSSDRSGNGAESITSLGALDDDFASKEASKKAELMDKSTKGPDTSRSDSAASDLAGIAVDINIIHSSIPSDTPTGKRRKIENDTAAIACTALDNSPAPQSLGTLLLRVSSFCMNYKRMIIEAYQELPECLRTPENENILRSLPNPSGFVSALQLLNEQRMLNAATRSAIANSLFPFHMAILCVQISNKGYKYSEAIAKALTENPFPLEKLHSFKNLLTLLPDATEMTEQQLIMILQHENPEECEKALNRLKFAELFTEANFTDVLSQKRPSFFARLLVILNNETILNEQNRMLAKDHLDEIHRHFKSKSQAEFKQWFFTFSNEAPCNP